MRTRFVSVSIFMLLFLVSVAYGQQNGARWRQVVGIISAGNTVGVGTGAITGGFLPWTTTSGVAQVDFASGQIQFEVRGLVFAAGSPTITIGTPGPVTAVKGALICDADGSAGGGNSVVVETDSVPLSATGDARFSGSLGTLPAVCSSEPDLAFVVRVSAFGPNAVEGPWIANGAVLVRGVADNH
jgi:hypothetical protein